MRASFHVRGGWDKERTKNTTDKDHRDLRGCQVSWPEARVGHFGSPCRGTSGRHPGFRSDCLPYTHQYLIIHSGSSSTWHQDAAYCPFWGFGSCAYCQRVGQTPGAVPRSNTPQRFWSKLELFRVYGGPYLPQWRHWLKGCTPAPPQRRTPS